MSEDTQSPASDPPRSKWRLVVRFVIALVLTAVVLGWLIKRVAGTDAFLAAVRSARPEWIALSFAAAVVCFLLTVLRWLIVLRAMGYQIGRAHV